MVVISARWCLPGLDPWGGLQICDSVAGSVSHSG